MNLPKHIARHFSELHFGGNMTWANLRDHLSDVTVEEANHKIPDFNTIAALAFHINYYISAVLKVLQGGPLVASDKLSYDHPPFNNQAEWEAFLAKMWEDARIFKDLTDQLPEERMWEVFIDPKYEDWYRNLNGMIEHSYYHMGQIVLLKKMVRKTKT